MNLKEFKQQIDDCVELFIKDISSDEKEYKPGDEDNIDIVLEENRFHIYLDMPNYEYAYDRKHVVTTKEISKLSVLIKNKNNK